MRITKLIASTLFLSTLAFATETTQVVEIKNNAVFAPTQGYDDNDLVQVVVDSYLPNACYKQGKTDFSLNAETKTIRIRQYAELSLTGVCAEQDKLPEELKVSIPFSVELNVGQLKAGNWAIEFETSNGVSQRKLLVDVAPTTTVDSLRYATVINAFVNDFVSASQNKIEIRLTIQLNSSCSLVSDNSKIIVQDNVVVILPEVVKDPNVLCLPVSRPAYKIFEFNNPGVGRYLLHARSLGGIAKNKLFTVSATR